MWCSCPPRYPIGSASHSAPLQVILSAAPALTPPSLCAGCRASLALRRACQALRRRCWRRLTSLAPPVCVDRADCAAVQLSQGRASTPINAYCRGAADRRVPLSCSISACLAYAGASQQPLQPLQPSRALLCAVTLHLRPGATPASLTVVPSLLISLQILARLLVFIHIR